MKTTAFKYSLLVACLAMFGLKGLAQTALNQPNINYDVHKEYDEHGNLIYYDSTTVYTWSSDSLINDSSTWDNGWIDKQHEFSYTHPSDSFFYSFDIPGHIFHFPREFDFGMQFPEIDDFLSEFGYNFSMTPSDTLDTLSYPQEYQFDFRGSVPQMNPNFNARINEMEQRMLEMHQRMMREFEEFYYRDEDDWNDEPIQEQELEEEQQSIPAPQKQSYNGSRVNI